MTKIVIQEDVMKKQSQIFILSFNVFLLVSFMIMANTSRVYSMIHKMNDQDIKDYQENLIQKCKSDNPDWEKGVFYECSGWGQAYADFIGLDSLGSPDFPEIDPCLFGTLKGPQQCKDKKDEHVILRWVCGSKGLEGNVEDFDAHGKLNARRIFEMGKLRKIIFYYPDGQIRAEYQFDDKGFRTYSKTLSLKGKLIKSSRVSLPDKESEVNWWEDVEEDMGDGKIEKTRYEIIHKPIPERCLTGFRAIQRKIINGVVVEEIDQGTHDPCSQ